MKTFLPDMMPNKGNTEEEKELHMTLMLRYQPEECEANVNCNSVGSEKYCVYKLN